MVGVAIGIGVTVAIAVAIGFARVPEPIAIASAMAMGIERRAAHGAHLLADIHNMLDFLLLTNEWLHATILLSIGCS